MPEDAEQAELLAQQMNSSDEESDDEEQEYAENEVDSEDNKCSEMEESLDDKSGEGEEMDDEGNCEIEEEIMEEKNMEDEHGEPIKGRRAVEIIAMNKAKLKSQKKAAVIAQNLININPLFKTLAERKEAEDRAKQISESRILTDADFRLLRIEQLRQQAGFDRGNQKRKRTNDELQVEEEIQEKFARSKIFFTDLKIHL